MSRLFAVLCIVVISLISQAQRGPSVTKAYADEKGVLHILTADGHEQIVQPKKWQAGGGFEQVKVAPDGQTAGWLADQMLTPLEGGTNYSYAVATELQVWRNGRVVHRFSPPAFTIREWIFVQSGAKVAFHAAPPHGQDFRDCTLFDVGTGKQLARWSMHRRNSPVPNWVRPLLEGQNLPGADKVSGSQPADRSTRNQ